MTFARQSFFLSINKPHAHMKSHHKLILTLASLALALTIPACGGGGGGGEDVGGSSSGSSSSGSGSGSNSSSGSASANSSLNGKTLSCVYYKSITIGGKIFNYKHEEVLTFSGSTVRWTHKLEGLTKHTGSGSYSYSRSENKGTIRITGLHFDDWNATSSIWTLTFHAGSDANSMGIAKVTTNGANYIDGRTFTLK